IMLDKDPSIPLEPGPYLRISVTDQGAGIPEHYLGKIFEPFFTTKQTGSGLGLANCYSIIRNHNGYISVDSQVGVGATFYIYLPASPDVTVSKDRAEKNYIIHGSGKLLVMDDEDMVIEFLTDMLGSIGYDVLTAQDGAKAVEMYKNAKESGKPFDAIIMDLTIPGGMSGRDAIREILKFDPDVKAIVSSGYFNDPIMANYREYGFSAAIAKPYRNAELSEVLHDLLVGDKS
ncbi:response regulator, partial [Candidatus Poribacteria bacterium]|nr:response regulator [Candidatus Poribacteria bacterium]